MARQLRNGTAGNDTIDLPDIESWTVVEIDYVYYGGRAYPFPRVVTYSGYEVLAGDGNDTVDGSHGPDVLRGQNGNDTLRGDVGDDFLDGGRGKDVLTGGAGADTFGFTGADYVATYTNTRKWTGSPTSARLAATSSTSPRSST